MCELVCKEFKDFGSDEFKGYIKSRDDVRASEADRLIIKLTNDISNYVIDVLKQRYGKHRVASGDQAFWELGINNQGAKRKAHNNQQEDPPEKRLPKEAYLNIIDLKEIIQQDKNWIHFKAVFNIPLEGENKGKKYYTSWIVKFNELRRIPAHKSALRTYKEEDFSFLDFIRSEFYAKLEANKL